MRRTWKVAGINFDHMHMGDLLRMVHEHPNAEIAGICDEQASRMQASVENFDVPSDRVFSDYRACLEQTQPDFVILCPATAEHGDWTEKVAPYGVDVLVEKPFAASLAEADRMIAAVEETGKKLAINWPMRWYPSHVTAHRLLTEGLIGKLTEVHYYDGNRGPLYHMADKEEVDPTQEDKATSWFYQKTRGGGSLLDYLGYGVTLGTWYHGDDKPLEVTTVTDLPNGLEVDEHSMTIVRYDVGLSKYETRWGTFTDPWIHQPQPKCGFVLNGTKGTISSYDTEATVRVQTEDCPEGQDLPADDLSNTFENPIQYFIHCLSNDHPVEGPLSPTVCRIGQRLVDAALQSAEEKRTIVLPDE
ncbi:MAG: Gfo/Idh/MocA family oxidoreductase [Opitutales bacterium]